MKMNNSNSHVTTANNQITNNLLEANVKYKNVVFFEDLINSWEKIKQKGNINEINQDLIKLFTELFAFMFDISEDYIEGFLLENKSEKKSEIVSQCNISKCYEKNEEENELKIKI
jgi:hypothetical protein